MISETRRNSIRRALVYISHQNSRHGDAGISFVDFALHMWGQNQMHNKGSVGNYVMCCTQLLNYLERYGLIELRKRFARAENHPWSVSLTQKGTQFLAKSN